VSRRRLGTAQGNLPNRSDYFSTSMSSQLTISMSLESLRMPINMALSLSLSVSSGGTPHQIRTYKLRVPIVDVLKMVPLRGIQSLDVLILGFLTMDCFWVPGFYFRSCKCLNSFDVSRIWLSTDANLTALFQQVRIHFEGPSPQFSIVRHCDISATPRSTRSVRTRL